MQNLDESHSQTAPNAEASAELAQRSRKRKLKLVLVTFGVIVTAFAVLFMMTENIGIAPFVYAIL
jgi:hypothetical protein